MNPLKKKERDTHTPRDNPEETGLSIHGKGRKPLNPESLLTH